MGMKLLPDCNGSLRVFTGTEILSELVACPSLLLWVWTPKATPADECVIDSAANASTSLAEALDLDAEARERGREGLTSAGAGALGRREGRRSDDRAEYPPQAVGCASEVGIRSFPDGGRRPFFLDRVRWVGFGVEVEDLEHHGGAADSVGQRMMGPGVSPQILLRSGPARV